MIFYKVILSLINTLKIVKTGLKAFRRTVLRLRPSSLWNIPAESQYSEQTDLVSDYAPMISEEMKGTNWTQPCINIVNFAASSVCCLKINYKTVNTIKMCFICIGKNGQGEQTKNSNKTQKHENRKHKKLSVKMVTKKKHEIMHYSIDIIMSQGSARTLTDYLFSFSSKRLIKCRKVIWACSVILYPHTFRNKVKYWQRRVHTNKLNV